MLPDLFLLHCHLRHARRIVNPVLKIHTIQVETY